jgi:RNA polymerase sigma-70 factor (ECF subfamily)
MKNSAEYTHHLLLQRLQNEEPAAFGELYANYRNLLAYVITRQVADPVEVEDLIQESFIKIWGGLSGYDAQKGGFVHWMARIARNTAIDFLRSRRHRLARATTSWLPADHADLRVCHQPEAPDLPVLVAALSPAYRQVIECVYVQGHSQSEVAEIFDMPLGTVKTRGRIGLRELRKTFLYEALPTG